MIKLIFSLLLFSVLIGLLIFWVFKRDNIWYPLSSPSIVIPWEKLIEEEASQDEKSDREDIVREKIENIKKRLALKGLIIEWDTYYRNREHTLALEKYLEFFKEHPDDPLIIEKIWNTYLETYEYSSALKYYRQIPDPSTSIKIRITDTIIYAADLSSSQGRLKARKEIDSIKLPDDLYFYYQNSIKCIDDFITCKIEFKDYFLAGIRQDENGEEITLHPKLQWTKDALENYDNFQLEEEYLEDAYIIWSLYTQWLYPISIELWNRLLKTKTDYKPIIKIIAQSNYELWRFQIAKDILTSRYEADSDDPSVAYLLGVINGKLWEYILANIYFKKALKIWYEPSINARRQLIHNYYLLENDENMLRAFAELVDEEPQIEKEDLWLAIYHHIIHDKYAIAQDWSKKWQELFPESSNFYAYESWVLREKWDYDTALWILQDGLNIQWDNPFILLNIWHTLLEKGNLVWAKRYFTQAVETAPDSQFAVQAKNELKKLEAIKKQEEQKNTDT